MILRRSPSQWLFLAATALKWCALLLPMAMVVGSACAFFLWSLDVVTRTRLEKPGLLYFLPLAGLCVGFVYHRWGKSAEGGNNLILDQIHELGGGVPARMAPLIFFGTVVTHLFGGSAGREGTAVQMGGSLAGAFAKLLRLEPSTFRILLLSGIAAGFGAVFGTPLAGAIFALEVLMIGRVQYEALLPCFIAALAADWTCHAWGVGHAQYRIAFAGTSHLGSVFKIDFLLLAKVIIAAGAFGLVSALFSNLAHCLHATFKNVFPFAPIRPAVGGIFVILLTYVAGTQDYLGLGVISSDPNGVSIGSFFNAAEPLPWSWLWKMIFTVITLASGFKGGEVTPLFFIGAALGSAMAGLLGAPVDLFAGLGFVAVFAGAANTPLACTLMGIELFGATHTVYIATSCFVAYIFSGHSGIYLSQRVAVPKAASSIVMPEMTLRNVRDLSADAVEVWPMAFPDPPINGKTNNQRVEIMPNRHKVIPREIGLLRIYLKPGDRRHKPGFKGLFGARPVYRDLVDAAKKYGIMNAVAHHTHYGYSNGGPLQAQDPELGNPDLTMCVELIGDKSQLDHFCCAHGDLLKSKVIVYKPIEHWQVHSKELEVPCPTDQEPRVE